jgi:DNA polymerase-4
MNCHPLILHVDADAFYASVEQVLHPELRGKAVIVGANNRGVVSAASYEARRFGVHSAMPVAQARRLCPHGVFLEPNFAAYSEYSRQMFEIMRRYSPAVEATSVDEGYVDLSGTLRLHKAPPWEVAHRMLQEIRVTLGINVSGGLAGSKMAAKMATGLAKPNGLLYLEPEKAWMVLGRLPVGSIPGVGKKTEKILRGHGIITVADLAASPGRLVGSLLGQWGEKLPESAAGHDYRPVRVEPVESQKSYSKERTLAEDTTDYNLIRHVACEIAEKLSYRLREDGKGASTVTLKVRYADFTQTSRSISLREPTNANAVIFACLDRLFGKAVTHRQRIRQVGVKLSGIGPPVYQEDLFEPRRGLAYRKDRLADAIRNRFGFTSVRVADCFLQGHRWQLK